MAMKDSAFIAISTGTNSLLLAATIAKRPLKVVRIIKLLWAMYTIRVISFVANVVILLKKEYHTSRLMAILGALVVLRSEQRGELLSVERVERL